MTDPLERFRAVFFEESAEAIDAIERNLLNINESTSNIDSETINDIFRSAHSLKGGSATFGMGSLTEFTHVMETLLDKVRSSEINMSQDLIDCLFSSLDILRNLVAHYQYSDAINESELTSVRTELERLLTTESNIAFAPAEPVKAEVIPATIDSTEWQIGFHPRIDIMTTGNDPLRYLEELADLGSLNVTCDTSKIPDFNQLNPTEMHMSWDVHLSPTEHVDQEVLDDVFLWIEDEAKLSFEQLSQNEQETEASPIKPTVITDESSPIVSAPITTTKESASSLASPTVAAAAQEVAQVDNSKKRTSQSIRVDLEKIDSLINLLGELVITQSMLSIYGDADKYPQFERLTEGLAQLERHTRDLQEGVMRIRMLPIDFCFSRFPRMVRDLAKKLDKSIAIKIIGEATEVDKTVIEELTDPLVHLVRNCVDHGIEMPDVRVSNGKPETGTVTLKAFHQVGNIIIEISDDGAGLNTRRIQEKAVANNILDHDANLTDQAIHELIFAPGFSTASEVTDLSGRGVGMDVVKRNIKALGGTIDVKSVEGQGSTFTIRLPLTLAILDGQLVRVRGETYIIPMLSIIESIQMKPADINRVGDTGVSFKWRGNFIPIINLAETFNCPADTTQEQELLVVVESDGKQAGLLVNELTNHQQVVVKSLEANYRKVDELSGATILGDGSVALIIDVGSLISRVRMH